MIKLDNIKFAISNSSPEILLGVGIATGIVAIAMACKATLKLEEEIDKTKEQLEEVKEAFENVPAEDEPMKRKNITRVYICGAGRIARNYAPAVLVEVFSIGCILYGHRIITKRNIALAGAYEALDTAYRIYRERVISAVGEETEKKIRYGYDVDDIEYVHVDDEFKEKKKSKKNAKIINDSANCSPYARAFDEGCINWTKSPEKNLYFLRIMQAEANDLLHSRGHIFLNEVYDMLGIPRTEDGQLVGWIRGGNDVDFGIYNVFRKSNRDFINGYEPVVLLDFNVDGLIYNKL